MIGFLKDKDNWPFIRFGLAQLISQFGDRVHQMALVGFIATRNPGSSFELAKLLSFTIIPVFIIGPIAGVYVDRWDRRATLFVCDFIRGVLVLSIAFYFMHLDSIIPTYLMVFLIFAFSRFYVPAKLSFIPEIVKSDDLHIANSLASVTGMIALVLGALLGGLIVEHGGAKGGFLWDAVTYFISGLLVFSIPCIRSLRLDKQKIVSQSQEMVRLHKSVWHEIHEGIQYISANKEIRFVFGVMSILFAAAGAIYVVIIVFIQQAFGTITKDLGFLAIPLGAGLFCGSMMYGKWGSKLSKWKVMFGALIAGGLMAALFTFAVSATQNRLLAGGLAFMLGLVSGPIVIASNTVINSVCRQEMSGKVFAALEFVMHLAFLLAMLASAFAAEYLKREVILMTVSAIFIVVGCIGFVRTQGEQK